MLDWAIRKAPEAVDRELTGHGTGGHAAGGSAGVIHTPPKHTGTKPGKEGIALALGGGVAKGWAHIGALRALDEYKIPVRMIAGTSIGALVGGCYLAGKLDALEEFARGLTKKRIFGLLDFHLGGNGLLGGLKLDQKLKTHLDQITFADLDRPFVCVSAEIRTGHEIWISSGSLITAMRASFALPGVFEPVICNNRLLVDGALVNPVPVSVCRAYEQMAVVAINMHYDHFGRAAVVRHDAGPVASASGHETPRDATLDRSQRLGITGTMVEAFNIIRAKVQPGDSVLIWGIGGGVALAALQIAKHIGATVWVTSSSPEKLARAQAMGADHLLDHRQPDLGREIRARTGKRGVDVVIDSVGEATWSQSLVALGKRGRLVTCGGTTGPHVQVDVRRMFWNQWTLMGSTMGSDAEFDAMTTLFRHGALQPPVDSVWSLADARQAFERLDSGAQFGKVVVRV